ncbi:hypothetical protein QFC22_001511 [Naganishia vaughanmartiniae]|uniref:Uncharacterized protein n=1 Tax=Naganishia vaughanmartiniae TaxID=1424756 RepID=A0ACC2XJ47_9TREE|nr:hypothetical protein QFC22_001511 [Naganishia vaughanmartiniae]
MSGSSSSQSPSMVTAAHTPSSSKLRQRNRVLSAQNDSSHPQIDEILAQKVNGSNTHPNGSRSQEAKPQVKGVSTSRPTSPLMPIVRSLERLGEKVPSLPKMPGMPDIKLPASSIEVNSMPIFWPLIGPYLVWIFWFDKAPNRGGRTSMWFRRWKVWKHFAGYYPVRFVLSAFIIKEADLPPDRPYVFGYHPHGIIGTGAFANFGTESTEFSKLFPGIKTHLLTLSKHRYTAQTVAPAYATFLTFSASNFKIPLYRELLLFLGLCSVSKKSCSNILRMGPGSTITIVVGGAAESLAAHPGTNDLTLRKRLGFIKIAVREGLVLFGNFFVAVPRLMNIVDCRADLVPVFSFGENDVSKAREITREEDPADLVSDLQIYDQLQVWVKHHRTSWSLTSSFVVNADLQGE